MKTNNLKLYFKVLWYIKVSLIDKQSYRSKTHRARFTSNVQNDIHFVIQQCPVFLVLVYHYSFDSYPQPVQSAEILLQVDVFEAL